MIDLSIGPKRRKHSTVTTMKRKEAIKRRMTGGKSCATALLRYNRKAYNAPAIRQKRINHVGYSVIMEKFKLILLEMSGQR